MIAAGHASQAYLGHERRSRPTQASLLLRVVETLFTWRERARSRRMLAGLDDRMLRDIGISSGTALEEADKPFWRS